MTGRNNEPPLPEPLAYFLTWTTYGTWLPGDDRGWTDSKLGWQAPDESRVIDAKIRMQEHARTLNPAQRRVVEEQITETCKHHRWTLLAANCRSNHVHVVVNAPLHPKVVSSRLKAWCTRRLKEFEKQFPIGTRSNPSILNRWWSEGGSHRFINDEAGLEAAVDYVRNGQDRRQVD